MPTILEVYGGTLIDYTAPTANDIHLDDIAHALSLTCRYGGHCREFYSVAEHALLVSRILKNRAPARLDLQLAGLHHDDHEAYLGDLPTPLKSAMGATWRKTVSNFDAAIAPVVGVPYDNLSAQAVQWADAVALRLEVALLKHSGGATAAWQGAWEAWNLQDVPTDIVPGWEPGLTPSEAEAGFLAEHAALSAGGY